MPSRACEMRPRVAHPIVKPSEFTAMVSHSDLLGQKALQRGLDDSRLELERWFQSKLSGFSNVRVTSIQSPPADSGFSSEIYVVGLERNGSTAPEARYVLKRQPAGYTMFEGRDFGFERRVQEVLAARTSLPVPSILGWEDDSSVLGGRFYLMSFVEGQTPPSNPSPHAAGMLVEMSPEARRRLWFSGLECLAQLHRVDPLRAGFRFLSRANGGESEFLAGLSYWERHYESSCDVGPLPLMIDTAVWLRRHAPSEDRLSLVWGDARIGNMLFDDAQRCVGMIDWELASLGDPLQDLAYWSYSDDHFAWIAGGPLPGWPGCTETVETYETAAGVRVDQRQFKFYRIYAGYWIVCTLSQLVKIKKACGQLPVSVRVDEAFTPVRFLRDELETA
jgi:aminoglycoside phosphotransferase (APT) family kinase protein